MPRRSWGLIVVLVVLLGAGCSSQTKDDAATPAGQGSKVGLQAEVASYDLSAEGVSRFLVGLVTQDNRFVSYGTVRLGFAFLGKDRPSGAATGTTSITATGRYLPVPGSPPAEGRSGPAIVSGAENRGVYAAGVTFDRAGWWGAIVSLDLQGRANSAQTTFEVAATHQVPAVGDAALKTKNLTTAAKDAPKGAVDSRAATDGKVPDPELHQTTIAAAIADRRPVVAVFSTPVYCVSRFCGPITDMVAQLAGRYRDRAEFVHVEVWRDFEKREVNKAAADWLYRGEDLNEPWVFVIGPDGKITARFDNVAAEPEVEAAIRRLPARP